MKVFLSWSGNRSKDVAILLNDWLCCVIQAARPWISTRDLDRGSLWFGEINDQLKDTTVGIICLTQENKNRPWILFEAGALAKGLSTSRVCTLLVDLEPKDIEDPLAQFNHTFPSRESMLSLTKTLNTSLGASALDSRILEQVFNTYWPQFEEGFKKVLANTETSAPSKPRPKEDMLGEILDNTRVMATRIRKLEYELDRSRGSEIRDMPLPMMREKVRMSLKSGLSPEDVIQRFRGEIPMELLLDLITRYSTSATVE